MFRCIKSFKLVVHGGLCIHCNDNIVILDEDEDNRVKYSFSKK